MAKQNQMQTYTKSTKAQIIEQLHGLFIADDNRMMDDVLADMMAIMQINGITFRKPEEIPTDEFVIDIDDLEYSFHFAVNSLACEQLPNFAVHCEAFLNFDEVIRKDNERNSSYIEYEEVPNPTYHVIAIAGTADTLLNNSKPTK